MRVQDPVAILNSETPLRVWSVIVTIFGDVIMRQGRVLTPEPVWIGSLLAMLELLGIDAAQARTNLSRLVANGTLERSKIGRNTFYRLSRSSSLAFADAARRIYGDEAPVPTGRFHVILIDRCAERARQRADLEARGVRFLSATTGLQPEHLGVLSPALPRGAILAAAICGPSLAEAAAEGWNVDDLNAGFRRFCASFEQVDPARITNPDVAMAMRIVLVHQFRRLVLRDPVLPETALPPDWQGKNARGVFERLHAGLVQKSESWLETLA